MEADKNLVSAKEYVDSAIESLAAIVVHECDGYDEFTESFTSKMRDSMIELIAIRQRLRN